MDSLLSYYPTIVSLCEKLSFQELKSLSLASKGWYEASNSFIVNRTIIKFEEEKDGEIEFDRKYKHVKVRTIDYNDVHDKLSDSLETLELVCSAIENFSKFKKFKKLKTLSLNHSYILEEDFGPTDLVLGLDALKVYTEEQDLNTFQLLIRANGSIRSLSLEFTSYDEDLFEGEFNDFLRNIHLPKLQELSITTTELNLRSGLKDFFPNHKDLKVCLFNDVNIKDETVTVLRTNCTKLEKVGLKRCVDLSGVTLNELKLMSRLKHLDLAYTNFTVKDLENFNPRQLESFRIRFAGVASVGGLDSMQTQSILLSMSNLKVLNLSGLQSYNGDSVLDCRILPFIAEQMPNLMDLNLRDNFAICDEKEEIEKYLKSDLKFAKLEKLDLASIKLTDQLLCLINAPKLRVLLMDSSIIESKGVKHVVDKSPLIENLSVCESDNLVDSDVTYITKHLPLLRKLDLEFSKISEECFKTLVTDTYIEECTLSIRGDCKEFAKWKEGFEAIETSNIEPRFFGDPKRWMITNGARRFYITSK